mmetsp:Transcript_124675/g.364125  ORF Transcript_124675/g.364125 Transcript_124675/m.364125 type:complete len:379 (-) Transcript_124675:39-1175(-)
MVRPMKLVLAVVAFVLAHAGVLQDLGEKLEAQTEADRAASENARCWCKRFTETLASRQREAESELQHLEAQRSVQHFDNEGLRLEVAGHEAQAREHQQALDAGSGIAAKEKAAYEEEQASHESALKAIRKAMDKIPQGSGSEVHGALRGLENTFQSKKEAAQESYSNNMDAVLDSKAEMLRLANEAAAMKSGRLAAGIQATEKATIEINLYTAQREADTALSASMQTLCEKMERDAAARTQKRQSAEVAVSQANVRIAQEASRQAMSNAVFLHHGSRAKLSGAFRKTLDSLDLSGHVAESNGIQSALAQMLSTVVMDAHLVQSSEVEAQVKGAMESLGQEAQQSLDSLPQLFDEVRSAGQKSTQADQHLHAERASARE